MNTLLKVTKNQAIIASGWNKHLVSYKERLERMDVELSHLSGIALDAGMNDLSQSLKELADRCKAEAQTR